MCLELIKCFCRSRFPRRGIVFAAAAFLALEACVAPDLRAQEKNSNAPASGVLAAQNMSRVAATAADIRTVLTTDAGLMVEVKRWVARDATEHGQILDDADLTDNAILERIESDVAFRAVVTMMVQRYGYLQPKYDPASDLGKQRELFDQERAKWLAQNQDLTQAREERPRDYQNPRECEPQTECNDVRPQPSSSGRQEQRPGVAAPRSGQGEGNPSDEPDNNGNTPSREPLLQTEQQGTEMPSYLPVEAAGNSASVLSGANVANAEAMNRQVPGFGAVGHADPFSSGSGLNPLNRLESYAGAGADQRFVERNEIPTRTNSTTDAGRAPAVGPGARLSDRNYLRPVLPPAPDLIRKISPYNDIPSFYDMYVQAVTRPQNPERFGANLFENGAQDSQLIPMDLPAGTDYVVGPGDGLSVDLWGGVSQRIFRTVDREGRISLPEVGPVLVSGKSLADVQQNLQQVLKTQFRDVSADVSLSRLRTVRVYEVGDVARPGAYDISSLSTPLNALFEAGGPTPRGSLRILKHYRGNQLLQVVDVYDLLLHGVKSDMLRLENGDTVQVPPIGPTVTVEGMVRRPAVYELKDEKTLANVLDLAGGLLPAAALRHIEVQRLVAHEKQTMLSLDIAESADTAEINRKLDGFDIHDGDRIRVYPIAPYNQDTIYLEGHVVRPGRYSYRTDMRVSEVISSFKDLLPEPATQYAEIIRLNAPDFHPTVESFDLAAAIEDPSHSPVLHPLDTIRIYSRFDFENPPSVSILGDVRAPGTYKTPGQIRVADAVHLAGGLTPEAQLNEAQVFRTMPDGKSKVLSVNLGQALDGDPLANILLQTRDRLLIHQSPDAAQMPAASVLGEVTNPGRFPLGQGMRVSDLIRVGGGLKHSADTETADLTEVVLQNGAPGTGTHRDVKISAALSGSPNDDVLLHDGDTLTIRQIPGWNDLGAVVTLGGEVAHPGKYGIRPGERLSSVLERAGGFLPSAYPDGMVLEREDVRKLEQKSREDLIARLRQESVTVKGSLSETGQDQAALAQAAIAQRNAAITALEQAPVTGRLVLRLPADFARFRNSPDDIEVRRGDSVFVPKRPEFIVVVGQVYNSNAITYRPHREVGWYLRQAGGPTDTANTRAIFVIRASGSVVTSQGSPLWHGGTQSTVVEPGDTIVVPEKSLGGGNGWKNLIAISQLASAAATTAFIATH